MSFLLWQADADLALGSSRLILRADEVPQLLEAQQLRDALQTLHREQEQRVEAACEASRAAAHALGLEQGRQAARDELGAAITSLSQAMCEERERVRDDVAMLALQVVRKLMGQMALDAQLVGLAAVAAREVLPAPTMTLVVHPDQSDAVRARLAQGSAPAQVDGPAPAAWLVRDDASLPAGGCRIETELGSVDASLDAQLARLAAAWGVAESKAAA
jgi:flagellar biosynthesis/type III secretory pathway protein FliH